MKTIPPTCPEPEVGPKYWRSLDQLADTPEFRQWAEREFPAGASEFSDPLSRRNFVKIMSASFLLAGFGLTGCRRPEEQIHPFSKVPNGYIHGVPQFYATSRPTRGSAVPLLVKSSDGRPTKVEGNPSHPISNGGSDRYTQASILNLYDPDRAIRFAKGGNTATRAEALDALAHLSKEYIGKEGAGLSFLVERSSSPSRERLQKIIAERFPKSQWYVYEAVDLSVQDQAASTAAGQSVKADYHFSKAKRIVSLDCDFIGAEEDAYRHINGFSKNRKVEKAEDAMNRLYVIEGLFTLTGSNADHRLRIAPSQVIAAAAALLKEVSGGNAGSEVEKLASAFKGDAKWIAECAKDLVAHKGESLVVAGYRQPLAVHLIANAINAQLEAIGKTVNFLPAPESKESSIVDLAKALNAGEVETLFIFGANPAYTAPVDLDWANAQKKAKTVVRLAYYEDETAASCTWHFPAAHYLESWGDARTSDGTYVAIQPLIEPLFGGMTEVEVLARLAGQLSNRSYDIARDTFKETSNTSNFEEDWKKFLHAGFWQGSAPEPVSVEVNASSIGNALANASVPAAGKLELAFFRDYKVDDGRYTNNGWLQELPDPVSKIVWENTVLLSPKTAADLGLKIENHENNDLRVPLVTVQVGKHTVQGPAWIQPGQADGVVGLALGYGRSKVGRIGKDTGFNAYSVRTSDALYLASADVKVTDTGKQHKLATTQEHGAMEGRPIVREGNLDQFQKNPKFSQGYNMHEPKNMLRDADGTPKSMYPNPLDERKKTALHQWGMVIDLSACIGCNTCSVACQSENNVPIVGKDLVSRGREMHWLRVDRYYAGSPNDPQMVTQPMLCQHCEAAPCENVCPVNATSHDEEGLNVMTYNRCVGTRYCSNNCPYKVRRFNFLDYNKRTLNELQGEFYPTALVGKVDGEWGITKWLKDPTQGYRTGDEWELYKMVKNPDVTVRMRGVMEKCTFCLQRIEQAKIGQKVKAGPTGDVRLKETEGNIPKTACQQACPADAIAFGDISDPESSVSKQKANPRNYSVLEFLLTKPRLTYLAKIRNPNPEMPDYKLHSWPHSAEEYKDKNGSDPFKAHGHGGGHEKAHDSHDSQKPAGDHKKGAH